MNPRYSRARFLTFACVIAAALVSLFARLAWVQIIDHGQAHRQLTEMSQNVTELLPRRGNILDRLGYPLAVTEACYEVGVSRPEYWRDDEKAKQLAGLLGMSSSEIQHKLRGRHTHTYLSRNVVLSPEKVDALRCQPYLSVDERLKRSYPMDGVAARLLGRVNRSGHGDAGIERLCDTVLAGHPGRVLNRYDAAAGTAPIMRQILVKPVPGRDVILTLDHRVQMILEEELEATKEEAGASSVMGIVMDPRDGSVLAAATAPGIASRENKPYLSSEWRDPIVLDAFEPGSSFKLFTAASLLRHALCDTSEVFDGEGHPKEYRSSADMGGFTFHDVHPVGLVSLRVAFIVSSNIIFGKAASLLHPDEFENDLRRFGLGMPTGCGLSGESSGILKSTPDWSGRTQATMAIGQEISVTLLQMAAGYSALLTDGTLRVPRFVAAWRDEEGQEHPLRPRVVREDIVPPKVPPILRDLCRQVVQMDYGSGQGARVEGLSVGGKTGTAQIARSDGKGYEPNAYMADFIGVVPAEAPQLLVAIVVQRPKVERRWGGDTAAGCFSRVVSKVLSATRLLDYRRPLLATSEEEESGKTVEMPELFGLSLQKVRESLGRTGCRLLNEAPSADARVVGQMPQAGSPILPGGVVRVAWTQGGGE